MASVRVTLSGDFAAEAIVVAARETKKDLVKLNKEMMVDLVTEAERLWELKIVRKNEHESPLGKRDSRGLTDKIFGTKKGLAANSISKGPVVGVGFPDLERLNRLAKYWRAQEFGQDSIWMPKGVFVNRSGAVTRPQKGSRSGIFQPVGRFAAARGVTGPGRREDDTRIPSSSSDKNFRRDQRRLAAKLFVGGTVDGHEGKFFIKEAWENVTRDLLDEWDRIFERNWSRA